MAHILDHYQNTHVPMGDGRGVDRASRWCAAAKIVLEFIGPGRAPGARCRVVAALGFGIALNACASAQPLAPTVVVMPHSGETYAVFQQHDQTCRAYAANGSGVGETQQRQQATSTVAGAGIGAAAGALIGSASGHAGRGAAIGGGTGLLVGAINGQQSAARTQAAEQQHYDAIYLQCMAANGERLPPPPPAPVMIASPPRVIYVTPPPQPAPIVVYGTYPPF